MPINGKAMKGTPRNAVLAQPLVAPAHPGNGKGMFWGRDLRTGEKLCVDVQALRLDGTLNGLIMRNIGIRGAGKSAWQKSISFRMLAAQAGLDESGYPLPMHIRIIDQKPEDGEPEYEEESKALRTKVTKPAKEGKLNPLEAAMGDEVSLLEVAINLSETVLGRRLQRHEPLAHQIAVSKMYHEYQAESSPEVLEGFLRTLDEEDKNAYYAQHDAMLIAKLRERAKLQPQLIDQLQASLARPHNIPMDALQADAAQMATSMGQLLRGEYGGIFGGGNSMREMLSQRIATIDRTGMNPKARVIFDALMWRWQSWALDNNDQTLIPHLSIGDEEADSYQSLMYLRFYDEFQRKARAFHTWDMRAVQVNSQLAMAGAEGSETRELAKSIDRGVSIRVWGRQLEDDEVLQDITRHGTSDLDAWMCTQLDVGCFGVKFGEWPMIFFQHLLTPTERGIVQTNRAAQRMNERTNVHQLPAVEERLKKLATIREEREAAEPPTEPQTEAEVEPVNGVPRKRLNLKRLVGRS
jgi:hypothetical protein